jgi:hypothetical protein
MLFIIQITLLIKETLPWDKKVGRIDKGHLTLSLPSVPFIKGVDYGRITFFTRNHSQDA